jgi:hypothetical protein
MAAVQIAMVGRIPLANVGVGRAHRSYRAERESGIPRPTLAPHDDCNGGDRYCHMKKRYGNRQNVMPVFMTFTIPQLFLGLMFKHLTFKRPWRALPDSAYCGAFAPLRAGRERQF